MTVAKPGDIWVVDLGMAAKVRPCLVLSQPPRDDELSVVTVVAHTTALRGNRWEVPVPKPFLRQEGAFDVQRVATVASIKLERKLGELTRSEFERVLAPLAERLGFTKPSALSPQ